MAVSPEEGNESGDEAEDGLRGGIEGERIRAERRDGTIRTIACPRKPADKEVEDHSRTHLPYRNWCPYCVEARGKDLYHRKTVNVERGLNEFSFDYCFLANSGNAFYFGTTLPSAVFPWRMQPLPGFAF